MKNAQGKYEMVSSPTHKGPHLSLSGSKTDPVLGLGGVLHSVT